MVDSSDINNLSTPPSRFATSESSCRQDTRVAPDQGALPSASLNLDYSSIGPTYERVSDLDIEWVQQQQQQGLHQIPISERYEFAEIHDDKDPRVEVEVPREDFEETGVGQEQYSHLHHSV